jgi:hypothetical protein
VADFDRIGDDGVSPVMGVLLMVSITIAVAAILFFVARTLGHDSDEEAPYVQFLRDNQDGQLKVIRFTKEVDLMNIQVKVDRDSFFAFNDEADTTTVELPADRYVRVASTPGTFLQAGDIFDFCLDGPSESTAVSILVAAPDAMIYENSFTGLKRCTA